MPGMRRGAGSAVWRAGGIAALVACLLAASGSPARAGERLLLAIGDSLTLDDGVEGGTFVERLALPGVKVVNIACRGSSVLDWSRPPRNAARPCFLDGVRSRIDPWVGKVAAVHVLLGSNDGYGFGEPGVTPPEVYGQYLARLIERFEVPVIVSVPPPNLVAIRPLVAYREQIRAVVAAHAQARLGADFLMEVPLGYLQADGAHPTAAGHAFMADLLRPIVADALGVAPDAPLP